MKKIESFEDFKKSFFYGSRSDLNFKFLEHLSDEKASGFIKVLFSVLGDSFVTGDYNAVKEHVFKSQIQGYAKQANFEYDKGPFTNLNIPLKDAYVALLTSSGHFVKGDDPEPFGLKNMTQKQAEERIFEFLKEEPILSHIPKNIKRQDLMLRHGGYDTRAALFDPNTVFPLDRLNEIDENGFIGRLASEAYSFIGACSQLKLLKRTGPKWLSLLKKKKIDAMVLVPV